MRAFICKCHGKFIKYSYFQVQADGAKACIVIETYCTTGEFFKEKILRTVVVSYYRTERIVLGKGGYPLSNNRSFLFIIVSFPCF